MQKAFIAPMSSSRVIFPRLVDSDRSSNMYGGISFSWLAEEANRATNAADPAVGQITLEAKDGTATAWVSNSLMADAQGFSAFFRRAFGQAIAFYVDAHAFNGTGSGQPLGVIPSDASIGEDRGGSNAVNMVDLKELAKRFAPSGWKNGNLFVNQDVLAQLFELQSEAANSVSVLNLTTRRFFGIPITPTEYCPALGTTGDVTLADFSQYIIGNRDLIIEASGHVNSYWQKNQTLWKMTIRIDGQPAVSGAYTPYKGTNTISPFVVLNA